MRVGEIKKKRDRGGGKQEKWEDGGGRNINWVSGGGATNKILGWSGGGDQKSSCGGGWGTFSLFFFFLEWVRRFKNNCIMSYYSCKLPSRNP